MVARGPPLLPVGTLYDPFVTRAHEPWSFGIYAGGQSILVGTPSGVTLGPEGGAHQSVITPSVGLEQPGCVAWEPAFAQDVEWVFLHALSRLGANGASAGLRPARGRSTGAGRRAGGRAGARGPPPRRAGRGLRAARRARRGGDDRRGRRAGRRGAGRRRRARRRGRVPDQPRPRLPRAAGAPALGAGRWDVLERAFATPRPIVTVLDGHPHTLSFLAASTPRPSPASVSPSSASGRHRRPLPPPRHRRRHDRRRGARPDLPERGAHGTT